MKLNQIFQTQNQLKMKSTAFEPSQQRGNAMQRFKPILLVFLALLAFFPEVRAARFTNQFIEFELPPRWRCNLEGAEWVCQGSDARTKRDAIIILAAKLRGEQDSLDQYLSYLKKAKTYKSVKNKNVKSEPKYAKTVSINEHAWVDSLHLESELPGFYTRYLATVKKDIGVLVTFSVNKKKYQNYLKDIDNLINTLKVFRKSGGLNVKSKKENLFDGAKIPDTISQSTIFPSVDIEGASDDTSSDQKGDDSTLYLIILLAVVIGVIVMRKKKK